jgi:hypothetical protein
MAVTDSLIGQTISHYRIIEKLPLTKPMPMRKRNFRSAYTKQTLVSYEQ